MANPTDQRLTNQLERPQETAGNVGHAGSGIGPENDPHYEDHLDEHTHHVSMTTYYKVFGFLMVMLFVTVGAWYVDEYYFSLGSWSIPIAVAIATVKAVAIVLLFMHVKFSSKLVQIFACTGLVFMGIMFVLTFNDYFTRGWVPIAGR